MFSKNGFQHKVSDGTGLSDDLVCVYVWFYLRSLQMLVL